MSYEVWAERVIDASHPLSDAVKHAWRGDIWANNAGGYAEIRLVTNDEDNIWLTPKETDADGDVRVSIPELVTVWLKMRKVIGLEGHTLGAELTAERREGIAQKVERAVDHLESAKVHPEVGTDLRACFLELLGLLDSTAAFKIPEVPTVERESQDG